MDSGNPHLATEPLLAGADLGAARMVGVLLHGRDQDVDVMLDVARRLDLADVAYVLPRAAGRSWYPGRYFDPPAAHAPYIEWALDACDEAVRIASSAGRGEQVVLAGFSQGACVVAEWIARGLRPPLAGAAVLTGALLGDARSRREPSRMDGLPVLIAISRHDEWVAFADAEATARAFTQAGADVTFAAYEDRVHHVSDAAVDALRPLFRRQGAGGERVTPR